MRSFFTIILSIWFITTVSAQNNNGYTEMLLEAEGILYTQPQESLKIAEHLIEKSENKHQQIEAYLLEAGAYFAMGEFNNATKAVINAKKIAEITEDSEMQIKTSVASINLLNHLGLNEVAEGYYLRTKALTNGTKNENILNYSAGGTALINAFKYMENDNQPQVLKNLREANIIFEKIPNKILINETTAILAEVYLKTTNIDSTEKYLQSVLKKTNGEHPNNFLKMVAQFQLGKIYFLKKEYKESLSYYQIALDLSEQLNNKPYKSKIKDGLASSYLALDDTAHFYSFRTESDQLANEVELEEDHTVNSIYNYINGNNTLKSNTIKKAFQRNLLVLSGALALILLTWIALRYRYKNRAKQYERFLNYFEEKKEQKKMVPVKEVPKSLNIPKETEKALVQKLSQFENSKQFTKQDMSLAMLASHFDTNTKYLSEIINTHKDKNFNSYINELRINYIIDKLRNNRTYSQYKISYLAEESGFSSHSSFATVFKSVTGISPTVFIDLLKTTKKTTNPIYEEVE